MKRKTQLIMLLLVCLAQICSAQTFAEWFSQKKTQKKYLIAQIAALEAYKSLLTKGYGIVKDGTDLVGGITRGELDLHTAFFSSLKLVSAEVRQKSRADDIVRLRTWMEQDRKAMEKLIASKAFLTSSEKSRFLAWYHNIADAADTDLEELKTLLTDSSLELDDGERIKRISALHGSMQRKYGQQRAFSGNVKQTILIKEQQIEDSKILRKMYGF